VCVCVCVCVRVPVCACAILSMHGTPYNATDVYLTYMDVVTQTF
jgi:hypothetical protein